MSDRMMFEEHLRDWKLRDRLPNHDFTSCEAILGQPAVCVWFGAPKDSSEHRALSRFVRDWMREVGPVTVSTRKGDTKHHYLCVFSFGLRGV